VDGLKAKIDYPLLKQNITIALSENDEAEMQDIIQNIIQLKNENIPPFIKKTGIMLQMCLS